MRNAQTDKRKQAQTQHPHAHPQQAAPEADHAQVVAQYAQLVRRDMYPAYICGVQQNGIMADVPLASWRKYIEDYVFDATGSDCKNQPILRTLIEQLLLLNHTIGRLHGDAINASEIEHRRINLQLAVQLTGEQRRLAEEISRMIESGRSKRLPFPAAKSEKKGGAKNKLTSKVGVA